MKTKPVVIGMDPDYSRRLDVEVQTKLKKPHTLIVYGLEDLSDSIINIFRKW